MFSFYVLCFPSVLFPPPCVLVVVYKLFGLPVCRNESFYHDMQSDEVMYQTTQGYRNPFNSHRPQYHASIDTRGNNGPLRRHNSYR